MKLKNHTSLKELERDLKEVIAREWIYGNPLFPNRVVAAFHGDCFMEQFGGEQGALDQFPMEVAG